MRNENTIKIAIIDLNKGKENQGLKSLQNILTEYSETHSLSFETTVFELRVNGEIPHLDFDIYFSTGGPGSPFDGHGKKWEADFFGLLSDLDNYNRDNSDKKSTFLICHSFQLGCIKYGLGKITLRDSTAFGVYPILLTEEGKKDPVFQGLEETFYSVDSRNWQVKKPISNSDLKNSKLLALESDMLNVGAERCMMAIRFSNEMIGTQFHPEAHPTGVENYLLKPELKKLVIENHGQEHYQTMLNQLYDPTNLILSKNTIISNFLTESLKNLAPK